MIQAASRKFDAGEGCHANTRLSEREFSRSEVFLGGENRAVLREQAKTGPANIALENKTLNY